jgi:glycosyltransferase involved in cell wall biosynthesis
MIPRIIHQVWEGKNEPLPEQFSRFADTWKENHPGWQYEFWDRERMDALVQENYPDLVPVYFDYPYDAQRWNAIRYLILYRYGGVYADFDSECLEPVDNYVERGCCYFTVEPDEHARLLQRDFVVSNAFMAAPAGHSFLKHLIDALGDTTNTTDETDKVHAVLQTTGSLWLTDLYESWPEKELLCLLPSSSFSPWTHCEVQMYLRGELAEAIMEKKLAGAFAIHYHWRSWLNGTERTKSDVLYLSVSSGKGGSAISATRIHLGLRKQGIDSIMLVRWALDNSPGVYKVLPEDPNAIRKDYEAIQAYGLDRSSLFWPALSGIDIHSHIEKFNPAIIQMHWMSWDGFLALEDLAKIKKKIVWRLPDNWAMSGGCHHPGTCTGYMNQCGKCPILNSDREDDLSHKIWLRKKEAYKTMDITIVVPTLWMKETVLKSSLLCGRRVELIPNGLDVDHFAPIDKNAAKKALAIPEGRKVILYGAHDALKNPRKGFYLLKEALQKLSVNHEDDYEVLVFGADETPLEVDMPVRFIGYLNDRISLPIVYSAADVMIVPSIEEPFGQTVTEAMSCATPVVVFSDTGPASIIEHKKTGYVARHSDTDDLAKGIEWVLEDNRRLKQLSKNARERVLTTYDIRIVAQQYAKLYDSLIE